MTEHKVLILMQRVGGLFIVASVVALAAQAVANIFAGREWLFVVAGAVIAVSLGLLMLCELYYVLRARTVLTRTDMGSVMFFAVSPFLVTGGDVEAFTPHLILACAAAIVLLARFILVRRPRRTTVLAGQGNQRVEHDEEAEAERAFPAKPVRTTFADVSGMAEVKERLREAGQEITAAQRQRGAHAPRNGILLFGEPGNGKTFFAEALAGELRLPMINVTFGDVASRWVNQTTEQVMTAFRDAHAQAPCLLFIDEIDSLIKDRNSSMSSGNDEAAKTTNALLTELVKARNSSIVVVAATNFLDKLDQAAIREGRFDFKIEITPPDEPARAALIGRTAAAYAPVSVADEARAMAARRWGGFSVVRIRTVTDEACREAKKIGRKRIEYVHLQQALRTIQGRRGKLPENTPTVDGLIMPAPQKQRLLGLAARMRDIERIEAMGGTVPTGVLFWGPPGTGKTLTARALAKSSGWAFLAVSGNDLIANPGRIDEVAREARDIRPAIVFIDEADDVLADRRYAPHSASVTNRLLTAIDGAGGRVADLVWIAATNHPQNMDAAALRGGRFTEKLEFALPDERTIAEFVAGWMQTSKARFDAALSPAVVGQALHGLSIANVVAVLQQAVDRMIERHVVGADANARVTLDDLHAAMEVVSAPV